MPFRTGKASEYYGQHIRRRADAPYPGARERRTLRARAALGRPPQPRDDAEGSLWVPCVALADVLAPYPFVDLLDVDIQGAELGVLSAAMHALSTRVRRVHVGTHGTEIEKGLRQLFLAHGWQCLHDYGCQTAADTRYGRITFVDGVQSWINPEPDPSPDAPRVHATAADTEVERLAGRVRNLKKKVVRLTAELDALRSRIGNQPPRDGDA